MISVILMGFIIFLFLILFFIILYWLLGYVLPLFQFVEKYLGEFLSKLIFGTLFIVGLILWSWGHLNIHGAYTGAFPIALSALYFLSESLETLS